MRTPTPDDCELEEANTRFYWNKPFDLLTNLEKSHDW